MNIIGRFTILLLAVALFSHLSVALLPYGGAADACESDCCASAHQMAQMANTPAIAAGLCCVLDCPPDAEVLPLVTLSNPVPQPLSGLLSAAPPAQFSISPYTRTPRTPPRYLRDASSRYLKTGALLI